MSNFKGHTAFNLAAALPICTATAIYTMDPGPVYIATFVACFVYGTFAMSPDMDLAHQIRLTSVRGVLTLPFRGYSMLFRHRGVSHNLFLGTLTRIGWLMMLGVIGVWVWTSTAPTQKSMMQIYHAYRDYILWGFAGFFFADVGHLWMDR